jgi:hypothetical protein
MEIFKLFNIDIEKISDTPKRIMQKCYLVFSTNEKLNLID